MNVQSALAALRSPACRIRAGSEDGYHLAGLADELVEPVGMADELSTVG